MKKILLLLISFYALSTSAQTNTLLSVFDSSDSSKLQSADVRLEFITKNVKSLNTLTDSNGTANIVIPSSSSYYLLINKEGYKSFFLLIEPTTTSIVIYLKPLVYDGEEVTVSANRPGELIGGTFSQISKKEIEARNFGQDLPILLQNIPSAVTTSDAGAGIGYTGIRIRGIDPTRINVSINGVPINDAESQGVFWVNMPDLSSGIENIQVQRGVGTSSIGAGAFGAAIHIKTDKFSELPFAYLSLSQGSFNTSRQSLKIGTGRLKDDWFAEGRLSWIKSDGFINRASSDLNSWYISTGRKTSKSLLQFNLFSGSEKTYQSWNGVPKVKYNKDSAGIDSFVLWQWYDSAKTSQLKLANPFTYNYYTYPNETDNYKQTHLQIVYNRILPKNSSFNAVVHGTLGKGYYENFERKTNLSGFMDTPVLFYGKPYYQANLIHQRWLDNQFAGAIFSYERKNVRMENKVGAAVNVYTGKHFGKVIWHEFMNKEQNDFLYYNNHSLKTDASAYWKLQYRLNEKLTAFTDVQLRYIYYEWFGPNNTGILSQQLTNYLFFNPKAGMKYQWSTKEWFYLTLGRASREPVRDDFINSASGSRPKPEFMNNIEAAYKGTRGDWKYNITAFYMGYKDQLAITGKVNDVGGYTRINIPQSYRAGVELEASLDISYWINWSFNFALSNNKIVKFTEYVDDYTQGGQKEFYWEKTDMALSPSKIIGSQMSLKFSKNVNVLFLTKYVSRQYLDNTQNKNRSLDPYLINDVVLHFTPKIKGLKTFGLGLMVNNIGNSIYASNGYSYSGMINDKRRDFGFVYPQAGTNYIVKLDIGF